MKFRKKLIIGGFTVLAFIGTLWKNSDIPFLNNERNKNSYGINFGVKNKFTYGARYYGLNVGLITEINDGAEVYGGNISVFGVGNGGGTNGLKVSLLSLPLKNKTVEINDLQVGFIGKARGNLVQIGGIIVNYNSDSDSISILPLINWRFD